MRICIYIYICIHLYLCMYGKTCVNVYINIYTDTYKDMSKRRGLRERERVCGASMLRVIATVVL